MKSGGILRIPAGGPTKNVPNWLERIVNLPEPVRPGCDHFHEAFQTPEPRLAGPPGLSLAAAAVVHHLSANPERKRRVDLTMAQSAGFGGGTTFDRMKAIAQQRTVLVADRKARAERETHRFMADWQQALSAPGSRLGLGKIQADRLC
jgi:hypothetical protein